MNLLRDAEQYKLVLNIFSTYIQFADILKVFSFIFRLDVIFKDSKHIYFRIHMWIEEEKKSVGLGDVMCSFRVYYNKQRRINPISEKHYSYFE